MFTIIKSFLFFSFYIFIFSLTASLLQAEPIPKNTLQDYAADLISTQGTVETLPADTKDWISAQDFQKLFPGDIIRTGELSRAAILFVDHTQIKLNENTTLELKDVKMGGETEISWGRTAKSLFNLVGGEIWVHSGSETLDLQVDTPVASASIRGTEFVVKTDKKKTSVTVVNGSVNLANKYGEVLINSGEEGIAEEDKPPYKTVIINPEDAVQWSLYYPGNISPKDYINVPPFEMPVIEKFFDLYRQKKLAEAINLVKNYKTDSPGILTLLAFGELMAGNVNGAKENISKALSIDPNYSLAHSILSNIYLVQNNKEKAKEEAELAVKTNPDSPSAYVSLSWVKQSYFDMPGAIFASKKAIELDDKNIQAYVTLCRLLFGSDKIKEAEEIIDKALKIAPDESTVNATKGFLLLSKGETKKSIEYLDKSTKEDSTQGQGHLGLGLAYIRLKNIPEGLREMLIATLLEPKVSLYQSYMGKAYFQVAKEFARWGVKKEEAVNYEKYLKLAEKTLNYASYLDPRDPTPYLYSGILLTNLNRPVDAIERFVKSIKLNKNRAIYRSKLLLDKDRATENVSLSQAYDMIGLSAWGSYLAMRSVQSNFGSSGAHLFLGGTYLNLPLRVKAAASELLQSRILMPVNENSFNTYNNYTSLFEKPEYHAKLVAGAGEDDWRQYRCIINGGSGNYAFSQTITYNANNGYLPVNNDVESKIAYTYLKYALGMRSHIFATFVGLLRDEGDLAESWDPFENDPNKRFNGNVYEFALGYYHQINPDTDLVLFAKNSQTKHKYKNEYAFDEFTTREDEQKYGFKFWDGQIEFIKRYGDHQFIAGIEHLNGSSSYEAQSKISQLTITYPNVKVPGRYSNLLLRDYWTFNDFLEFDLAVRYQLFDNGSLYYDDILHTKKINPQAGILIKPLPNTTLRAAAIRSLHEYYEENIFPTDTSGFIIDHNDNPSAQNLEYALAWDQTIGEKTFFTISGSYRYRDTPTLSDITEEDTFKGVNCIFNRILNRYFALSAEYDFLNAVDETGKRDDHRVKLHLGFVHPSGWFGELAEVYEYQENEKLTVTTPFNTSFWTTNVVLGYEFPKKRGKLILSVENLFDKEFRLVQDPLDPTIRLPVRRVTIKAELYF